MEPARLQQQDVISLRDMAKRAEEQLKDPACHGGHSNLHQMQHR